MVYGMPKVAYNVGAVQKQVTLNAIAAEIIARSDARYKETL